MSQENRREFLLAGMLRGQLGVFDEVLIDCPPSLNLLTINALVAADSEPDALEFVTLDARQAEAAEREGLRVVYI